MSCLEVGMGGASGSIKGRVLWGAIAGLAWVGGAIAQPAPGDPAKALTTTGYVRVTQTDDGTTVRLEVGTKRFVSSKEGWPEVQLAGAVHVGDAAFYEHIQGLMDAQDVVLFESVKPSGLGEAGENETDEHRVKVTERRIRLLALAVERHRSGAGQVPASLDEVSGEMDERFARIIAGARSDGWGHAIVLSAGEGTRPFDLVSMGADGAPGGEAFNADLRFSDQKPLSATERGDGGPGIQKQLANALGLVFQPEAMDEGGPNWRNSDMSVDQVQEHLEAEGVESDSLFRMLSGESFGAKLAGLVLKLATGTEQSRGMMKLMMAEMLGSADELLAAGMGGMAGGERLMKVLIQDRNAVVIEDLERIAADEPDIKSVGILYGAGHLPDMEERLKAIGYTMESEEWSPAITVDLAKAGITAQQAEGMRQMMRSAIERQKPRGAKQGVKPGTPAGDAKKPE